MYNTIATMSNFPSANYSDGERVILDAANHKTGIFANGCTILRTDGEGCILETNGFLYPLGMPRVAKNIAFCKGMLGMRNAVKSTVQNFPLKPEVLMEKDFAFLSRIPNVASIPQHIKIHTLLTDNDAFEFNQMRARFLAEESGAIPKKVNGNDRKSRTKPVLMYKEDQPIGMVHSDFFSPTSAMINMLYIDMQHRNQGYGFLLMQWYIQYLLQESSTVCLFYSPNNHRAKKMYEKMGFEKREEWIMALFRP